MQSTRPTHRFAGGLIPVITLSLLVAGLAMANAAPQDALGDGRGLEHSGGSGRALDRNLRHGSGGSNAPGVQEDLRARNLIVTGNVAGGRGFRGNVGYTAERDFRASTSDDTSYAFRADSAFSDPRVARAGSMGDRLEAARNYGTVEYSRSAVRGSLTNTDINGTRLVFDQTAARLLSPEARRTMMDLSTANAVPTADGKLVRIQTGGFRGVAAIIESDGVDRMDLGLYDTARLKQDLRDGKLDKELRALEYRNPLDPNASGAPRNSNAINGTNGSSGSPLPGDTSTRIDPSRIDTGIRSLDPILREVEKKIDRRAARDAASLGAGAADAGKDRDPNGTGAAGSGLGLTPEQRARDRILKDLDDLRRELRGNRRETPEEEAERTGIPLKTRDNDNPSGNAADGGAAGGANAPTGIERTREREKAFDELVDLLRHGQPVDDVSGNAVERVQEILQSAESAMSRQAYFLAEQHYTTALTLTPSNPLAKAGLANAQLGAGLLSSAAITLRELYSSNPELIDARFGATILPPRARMQALLEKLASMPTDPRNASDVGLLTAYVGRQLGDRAVIERGLATLGGGSPADATMSKLLRGIWLGAPSSDGAVAPPSDAAPAPVPSAAPPPAEAKAPAPPPAPATPSSAPIDPFK